MACFTPWYNTNHEDIATTVKITVTPSPTRYGTPRDTFDQVASDTTSRLKSPTDGTDTSKCHQLVVLAHDVGDACVEA